MELPIRKIGGTDIDNLTAAANDVVAPEKFVGAGTEETQTGIIAERGSPAIILPVNGQYSLPAGNYGGGSVKQNLATSGRKYISPGANKIIEPATDIFFTDDVIVNGVSNLIPANIKIGVTVGGVVGTWNGHVNDDPNRLLYFGALPPGQSFTAFPYAYGWSGGSAYINADTLRISNNYAYNSTTQRYELQATAVVFDKTVDLTNFSYLSVSLRTYSINNWSSRTPGVVIAKNRLPTYLYTGMSTYVFNTLLEEPHLLGYHSRLDNDFDISAYSGEYYVYLFTQYSGTTAYYADYELVHLN